MLRGAVYYAVLLCFCFCGWNLLKLLFNGNGCTTWHWFVPWYAQSFEMKAIILQIRNNTLLLVWGSFAIHVLVILIFTTEHETNQTSVKENDILSLTWRTCVLSQAILFQLLASGFFRINWFHISTLLMQAVIQIFLRECKISWIFALALRFYFWRDERRPRRSRGFDRRGLHFLTKWTKMSF